MKERKKKLNFIVVKETMGGQDYLKAIDNRCGTTHNTTALSIFSATYSGILMLLTIPLNAVIVYCLIKERRRRYKSFFYKLLLNIAIADLLTGFIADPTAVNALWKEALRVKLKLFEVYVIHMSLFFTDAVALITLTVLSIDRIMALVTPIKHFKGMKSRNENIIVIVAWPIAFILVVPYFMLNFIKQLLVFSTINIIVCILSLVTTTITYTKKIFFGGKREQKEEMASSKNKTQSDSQVTSEIDNKTIEMRSNQLTDVPLDDERSNLETKEIKSSAKENAMIDDSVAKIQKKATRAFILMLCVFVVTYLPTCFTMIYMNVCVDCDCGVVHVMRDISILSILSSSVLRPLNFILTLKHLRKSVCQLFKKQAPEVSLSSTGVTSS